MIKMRHIIILAISVLILSLIGCNNKTTEFAVQRVIENRSGFPILIDVYEAGEIVETLDILAGGEHRKDELCRSMTEPSSFSCDAISGSDIRWFFQDSVIITFDQERKQLLCVGLSEAECPNPENIIRLDILPNMELENQFGFQVEVIEETRVYTYTITEEDYENAEPIGG